MPEDLSTVHPTNKGNLPMWFAVIVLSTLISATVRAELRDPNNSADYIILTSQEVLSNNSWIDSLLDYRAAQGRVSMAVTVEEIWAEFTPSGSDTAIREFLHYAYENWQEPQLKDVFIVGHWNVVPAGVLFNYDSSTYRSDYLLTFAAGSADFAPRFAVGRLPWSPNYSLPLNNFMSKIRHYEESLPGAWSSRCHLIADSMCAGSDCGQLLESTVGLYAPPSLVIERDYLARSPDDPWYGDCADVWSNLNAGSLFTCLYSAGFAGNLMPSCGLYNDDVADQLANLESLTIFSGSIRGALSTDSIDDVSVVLTGLNSPIGGFIAASVHTGIGWATMGGIHNRVFLREIASTSQVSIGDAWRSASSVFADSFTSGQPEISPAWVTLFGTCFLGDPATIIPGRSTSADPISTPALPKSIEIVGSYPNPFNPSTTINFMLNRAGLASLTVYDITGRAVTTLTEQNFTAGEHSIVWNAAGHASGMYLVRLESAGQFATHRVTLLK
jgi:hypothetical protein